MSEESHDSRITRLETHMLRLVGEDGTEGVINKIEKHLERMEYLGKIAIVVLILLLLERIGTNLDKILSLFK